MQPLAFLLGTWRGEGKGSYPTIEPFAYEEEVRFWHVGKPHLVYAQRTHHPAKGHAMHSEAGYWRPVAAGRLEIVLAHPTGVVEIQEGTVSGTVIDVRSTTIAQTATAKDVRALERTFVVDGDALRYEVRMEAMGVPLTHHLEAELRRVAD